MDLQSQFEKLATFGGPDNAPCCTGCGKKLKISDVLAYQAQSGTDDIPELCENCAEDDVKP